MSRPGKTTTRRRLAAAAILSAALLVPLGVFGGTGFASSSAAAGQYKITICHHTHSKKHPFVTIRISNKAWPAHQKHGDTLGACPGQAKHGKHNAGHHGKNDQHHGKNGQQHGKSGNAGTQGQTQSAQQGKSGEHANDHASDQAKGHGK